MKISGYTNRDNRGFTLIEVVVALLIVGILAAAVSVSVNVMLRGNVTRASSNVVSIINAARNSAITRGDESNALAIYRDEDGITYGKIIDISLSSDDKADEIYKKASISLDCLSPYIEGDAGELISNGNVDVAAGDTVLEPGNVVIIRFDKSSGGIMSVYVNGSPSGVDYIVLSGTYTRTVYISKTTGKATAK